MLPLLPLGLVHRINENVTEKGDLACWCRVARTFLPFSQTRLHYRISLEFYRAHPFSTTLYYAPHTLEMLAAFSQNLAVGKRVRKVDLKSGRHYRRDSAVRITSADSLVSVWLLCPDATAVSALDKWEEDSRAGIARAKSGALDTLDLRVSNDGMYDALKRHPTVQHLELSFQSDKWKYGAVVLAVWFDSQKLLLRCLQRESVHEKRSGWQEYMAA